MNQNSNDFNKYAVSMVVDNLPEHYFKAELLLFSLDAFSGISRDCIFVQCVNRVEQTFKDFIRDLGYQYREIMAYLDRTYCNKLQQLFGIEELLTNVQGIFYWTLICWYLQNWL